MSTTPPSTPASGLAPVLAARVLDLIRRGEWPVGHRLTEQALAGELGVSRSPVRKALQYLEELGALGSNPNRGFFVAMEAPQLRLLELSSPEESDEAVYMRVAEERLRGDWPDEVAESDLMQRYALTRLQVQRVLNRMAREGMAERKAGRGWVFRPVLNTVESHRESYRFRMIIEPAALLEPTFRIDKVAFAKARREQLQLLDGGIETWSSSERFRAGSEFHETLVGCSNNRFLIDALRNVNQLRRVIEYHQHTSAARDKSRLRRQCEEHLQLLDLIEGGDRIEASHRLRQHLDVVRSIKTGEAKAASASASAGDEHDDVPLIEVHL